MDVLKTGHNAVLAINMRLVRICLERPWATLAICTDGFYYHNQSQNEWNFNIFPWDLDPQTMSTLEKIIICYFEPSIEI